MAISNDIGFLAASRRQSVPDPALLARITPWLDMLIDLESPGTRANAAATDGVHTVARRAKELLLTPSGELAVQPLDSLAFRQSPGSMSG